MTTPRSAAADHLLWTLADEIPKFGPGPDSNYWPLGVWRELADLVSVQRLPEPFADKRRIIASDGAVLCAGDIDGMIDHEYRITNAGVAAYLASRN